MLPSISFRLSTYTTLALACAGLGYAESSMFPEVGVFALAVIIALAVIYRLETRVRLLSLDEANRLGAGIAVVALLWAGFRVAREFKSGEYAALGWPVFFVALTAPLLMAAVCAKLLRREKHAGDYWFMHAAGLAAIVLAGAMAEQAGLAVLTAAYALCAVWSMSHFHWARSNGAVPIIPAWKSSISANAAGQSVQTIAPRSRSDWRAGLLQAAIWTGVASAIAVPIYLVTPRSTFGKLDFGQSRIEIGYAADQMIDLTQTGDLRANPETAFEVTAVDSAGQPKEDLSPEQRWRGAVLITYTKGTWRPDAQIPLPTRPTPKPSAPWAPPNFGETGYRLTFVVPTKLRSQFLADPVVWSEKESASVADLRSNGPPQAWFAMNNGSVFGRDFPRVGNEWRYVQYTKPLSEKDLGSAYPATGDVQRALATNTIASVKEYADQALEEMVAAGRLPAGALKRDQVRLFPAPQYHEAIARALREYLSERADLVYTTELKRVNKSVDPIEDFLFYSKVGHCERFATALVLMLRSEGIPAVMVLGFKGCEHLGEGKYAIRQDHAHAWAEALISRSNFDEANRRRDWHWLSLDPQPVQSADSGAAAQNESVFDRGRAALERYMFHYTPEQREQSIQTFVDVATKVEFITGVALFFFAALAIRFAYRRLSRRTSPSPRAAQWFDRLLELLAKHGFAPSPGETAREFAVATAESLGRRTTTANQSHVPIDWVDAYYECRFGGTAIAESRMLELEARLLSLKQSLELGRAT